MLNTNDWCKFLFQNKVNLYDNRNHAFRPENMPHQGVKRYETGNPGQCNGCKPAGYQQTSEHVDDDRLEEVSKALGVSAEAIKNFNEDAALNIISNTFSDFKDNAIANANHCTFNPIDKIVELYESKIALYERLIKEKEAFIEKMLKK